MMTLLTEILAELRAIREMLEAWTAVDPVKTEHGDGLIWTCGHEHTNRREALECLRSNRGA